MKVFISRNCTADSVFRKNLTEKGIVVFDESLIEFSPVKFELPKSFNWIFFYSKRAVSYFFNSRPIISSDVKIAAIGSGTAEEIKLFQTKVADFIGDGIPETTAESFKKIASGQSVLFVRAEESKKTIQQLLQHDLSVLDLITYKNIPKDHIQKSDSDILLFTSSLNAEAYLNKYKPEKNQKLAAIGKSTALSIAAMGYLNIFCSESPDENALSELVLSILEKAKP